MNQSSEVNTKLQESIETRKYKLQVAMGTLIVIVYAISAYTEQPAPWIVYGSLAGIGFGARPETFIQILPRIKD